MSGKLATKLLGRKQELVGKLSLSQLDVYKLEINIHSSFVSSTFIQIV